MLIKYDKLIENKETFLKYAFRTCDSFALLFEADRPYKEGYVEASEPIHEELKKYLIKQHSPASRFYLYIPKGHILNIYSCNKQTKNIILSIESNFIYNIEYPEDIKFYRNNKLWFDSIYHENIFDIFFATDEDIKFLKELNVI